MKLFRHAELWLPGLICDRAKRWRRTEPQTRVWLAIADHYEPLWNHVDVAIGRERVQLWKNKWPEIASAGPFDSIGSHAKYTFFFPEEEYRPEFLDPLAEMTHAGFADVEIHIHHDRTSRQEFIEKMTAFCATLVEHHGLLRTEADTVRFGFIHGNWALDNSLPDGKWCGLNDEIQILRDLGCYADFTMPSGASPTQSRLVNTIYWCTDDPEKPKSYDTGVPAKPGSQERGDLLMIPGPLGIRWQDRVLPRLETGEIACYDLPTPYRTQRWFDLAPSIGGESFIKLYTHGTQERNSGPLLSGGLTSLLRYTVEEAARRGCELRFVTAWEMYLAIRAICARLDPAETLQAWTKIRQP